ncbi:RICIN domain-containing protein [Kitasatospora sp. NPDC049258]|uniref:RICIN domain-containing protein n=1 Tax=Kitasatospora sp. NPDC049258 TaxID=3155394 RepID=UPI00342DA04D
MPEPTDTETADIRITRRIRVGDPSAAVEILAHHRAAVLAHARLYCPDEQDAQHLTGETFALALEAVREGDGPAAAWRPYLASSVRHIAAEWAADHRAGRLSTGFTAWIAHLPGNGSPAAATAEADSVLLRALRALPEHRQTELWHALTDGPAASAPEDPAAEPARLALWEAYLQVFAQTSDRACRHLAAAMGDTVARQVTHQSLDRHTAGCVKCRRAQAELTAIHGWDRDVLYGALLPWTMDRPWTTDRVPGSTEAAAPASGRASPPVDGERRRDHNRALALCIGVAVTTVVAIVAVTAASPGADGHLASPAPLAVPVTAPPIALDGTAPAPPSPDASPTTAATRPPVPGTTATAAPTTAAPTTPAPSPTGRPAGFRLRNTRTGLCVGPQDPDGAFIQLQACTGALSQRWERVAAGRDAYQLRNTGTGKCLDGTSGGGNIVRVVQSTCLPAAGGTVQLWTFRAEPDGSSFRLLFVPPVPSSDYPSHLFGPQDWSAGDPPGNGTYLAQLPDYYHSPSFIFTADNAS